MSRKTFFTILKELLYYGGVNKDDYESVKIDIYKSNFKLWTYLHILLTIIAVISVIVMAVTKYIEINPWYIGVVAVYSIVMSILFLKVFKPEDHLPQYFIYLTMIIVFGVGLAIDFPQQGELAVTFVLLLVLLPVFKIDRPIRLIALITGAALVYLLVIYLVAPKDSEIEILNTMDIIIAWVFGIIISLYLNYSRLREFISAKQIQDEKTFIIDEQQFELQQKNQELQDALDIAMSASNAKTTFLFNMSHDIRTPMNAIIGFMDLAERDIKNPEKALVDIKKSRESSEILLNLINDILDMSRIESGKMELSDTANDITEVVNKSLGMLYTLANKKDITLNVKFGIIDNKYLMFDNLRLNQALINVVSNAIKYTNPGGTVDYTINQLPASINGFAIMNFVIKDNGIGMDKEFLPHIFEQFSREKTSTVSKRQGTGLGMAITKRIVDMMKGSIDVESELGVGSTFSISIPFKIVQDSKKVVSTANNVQDLENINLEGKKCLLVEDNELNREISSEVLKTMGFEVETAEDGSIAVDLIKEKGAHYYDIILMDIQMPVMDGYEATKRIRTLYPNENIPIIALSANAFEEDKRKSLAAGMNDHQSKPIIISELYASINKLLSK